MITPPVGTESYYTAMLETDAARYVINLLVGEAAAQDVAHVMLTSKDMGSELEAAHELRTGAEIVIGAVSSGEVPVINMNFNPLYLPNIETFQHMDVDEEGDIIEIDGFQNPFIAVTFKVQNENQRTSIDCKINWKQFTLPDMHEMINDRPQLLS